MPRFQFNLRRLIVAIALAVLAIYLWSFGDDPAEDNPVAILLAFVVGGSSVGYLFGRMGAGVAAGFLAPFLLGLLCAVLTAIRR